MDERNWVWCVGFYHFLSFFLSFLLSFFYPFFILFFILLAAKWIKIGFPRYKRQSVGFYPFLSFLFNLFLSFVYPFFILLAAKWIKIGFPRYKRQRAEEKCRILSFFILFLILCLSFFYPFLWWHKSATVFWKKRCLGSDTHTNSWHAILMLSCFIAKNSTQSDGRFRRLSRYSIFICHLFSWHIYAISLLPYISSCMWWTCCHSDDIYGNIISGWSVNIEHIFVNFITWLQIIYDILRVCVYIAYIYIYGPAFGGPHSSPRDGDIYKVMQVCVHLYV